MADSKNQDSPRNRAIRPAETLSRLDTAVASDGLEMVFQPIVSLPEEAVVGFEALARWNQVSDMGGILEVLARAAATGKRPQLDRLYMHKAIESALTAGLAPDTMLFLNSEAITPHISRADDEVLARGAERLQLVFEITERRIARNLLNRML